MELSLPLAIGFVASFFLVAMLTLTAFVKISIVFMIIRNAIGLQQVPSNMILMALSLFLAVFLALPVFNASARAIEAVGIEPRTFADLELYWRAGIAPFQSFLASNIDPEQIGFFVDVANEVWKGSGMTGGPDDFIIQVPSFMVTELTEAFEIGFLLYLPFIAIDLAVTGILMAMGMQMVQPNIIAVPFKLLLFVAISGWTRLVEGLVLSYAG